MGYSARYHAASLAAVFLALAVGILVGSEFGDDVVSNTKENLEQSLADDLREARERADDLEQELARLRELEERIYPALVGDRLQDRSIGVLALGGLPADISVDIEEALEPAGGELGAVAVLREPPDLEGLASALEGTRLGRIGAEPELIEPLGRRIGRQLVRGGPLIERVGSRLFSRASGSFGGVRNLIVVRAQPDGADGGDPPLSTRLESAILDGATRVAASVVGVERTDTDPSAVPYLADLGLTTVDHLDTVAGMVALVFGLLGAEGSFGVKETADRLVPDLLIPTRPGPPAGGRRGNR